MDVGDLPGLSEAAKDRLRETGITSLYPPQAAAVREGLLEGENLVASVPTASGKTLIAVLAMLSSIERGGKALYIVPLRALASEKRDEFAAYESLGLSVGVSTGNYESTDDWLARRDIVVATSEKVDSLIRNGASWIDEVTCVVADEVHLVNDASRGPTLEVTLAKLHARTDCQLVALSATIGNADEIARWLDARLVASEWRPIPLRRGVFFGNAITFEDGSQYELAPGEERPTARIVRDTVAEDGSVLVFVSSRRNAEAAAKQLGGAVEPFLDAGTRRALGDLAEEVRGVSDTQTSRELARAVERGAAFHHAGCASEHRSLVEDAFRDRVLKVVCATPTLAAGVNTPSRRVVVREWQRYDGSVGGMQPLPVLEVHQMFGRAGRPQYDEYGEAVVIAKNHGAFEELFDRYVTADPEPVRSKLATEPALRTHILAAVATGFSRTRSGLLGFLERTLYAVQTGDAGRLELVTDGVLGYLERNGFIETDGNDLAATRIGHTVSRVYVDPMSAAEIIDGLEEVTDPSALGLFHLISRTPDMYELYLRSGDYELYTSLAAEREDEFLGRVPSEFETEWEDWLAALKTAKLLEDWVEEFDEDKITNRYRVGPGDIRGKVETSEWLLGAAERLAGDLGYACVPAIRDARLRVEHGVREDALDLVRVRGVGRVRARKLRRAGIRTRADLREADKAVVLRALDGQRKTTEQILRNAGRSDPSLEEIEPTGSAAVRKEQGVEPADREQTGLGDFGQT